MPTISDTPATKRPSEADSEAASSNGSSPPLPGQVDYAFALAALKAEERGKAERATKQLLIMNLPDAEVGDPRAFDFVPNLAEIMDGGVEAPAQLIPNLILEGRLHWLAGHPGHGKTTVAMFAALRAMKAGRHVVWLDWEAGMRPTAARLLAVGCPPDLAAKHFHLGAFPKETGFDPLERALAKWPGALVVFDSASKALSSAGFDENSTTETTRWTTETVMPVREAGGTVLVIDHVTKGATRTTPYPRGSGTKLADTDAFWYVECTAPFNRERAGEITLHRHKDREGVLPAKLVYAVGDGKGGLPFEESAVCEAEDEGRGGREHDRRTEVLAVLRRHDGDELTGAQVLGMLSGRKQAIYDALRELAADSASPVSARAGGRGMVFYRHDALAATALAVAGEAGE